MSITLRTHLGSRSIAGALLLALTGLFALTPHLPAESASSAPPASETSDTAAQVTLKGEIVDLACYLSHEGKGDGHALCAKACVRGGAPVGLLADGRLFVLFAPHESAAPFDEAKKLAGGRAEVTGTIYDRNGLRGLAVTKVAPRS